MMTQEEFIRRIAKVFEDAGFSNAYEWAVELACEALCMDDAPELESEKK